MPNEIMKLTGLPNLQWLDMAITSPITLEQLEDIRKKLPSCQVHYAFIKQD